MFPSKEDYHVCFLGHSHRPRSLMKAVLPPRQGCDLVYDISTRELAMPFQYLTFENYRTWQHNITPFTT